MKLKFDPFAFETRESGKVKIHVKTLPWVTGAVHVRVIIHAGARHDPIGKEGIAHFFEHMPFDGCEGFPTRTDIEHTDRTLFMDTLNANTSMDRTSYGGKIVKPKLAEAMGFIQNFVLLPVLALHEVTRERAVIIQEIWKDFVSVPIVEIDKLRTRHIYGNHTMGRMVYAYGWADTVETIEREELLSFHRRHYHRGTMELVFVGDITADEAVRVSEAFVAELPEGVPNKIPPIPTDWPAPSVRENRVSLQTLLGLRDEAKSKQTEIRITRLVQKSVNEQLLTLFEQTLRQLLVETIRGKLGATYSPKVGHCTYSDHYQHGIGLRVRPSVVDETQSIVATLLTELRDGNASHNTLIEELRNARMGRSLTAELTGDEIANCAVNELSSHHRIVPMQEVIDNTRKLRPDDIAQLIQEEFGLEKLYWSIKEP